MTFVVFTLDSGEEVHVNPAHVRTVHPRLAAMTKKEGCILTVAGAPEDDLLYVTEPQREVALSLSLASTAKPPDFDS